MRKILVVLTLLFAVSSLSIAENPIGRLPAYTGGYAKLKLLLRRMQLDFSTTHQRLKYNQELSLVAVYRGTASGIAYIGEYMYGCTTTKCKLLAWRSTYAPALTIQLSKSKKHWS